MLSIKKIIFTLSLCGLLFAGPALAEDKPGKGVTLQPARATWNTGFFQEALVRRALTELGYKVKKPKTLQNTIFYKSLTLGDIDYWANGWFPMQDSQLPKDFPEKGEKVGYVVKAGGLQGYLVSQKHVEQYNIQSLADFKRDEVKKAFDKNKDGKADLLGCPPGWACERINEHHLEAYGLKDHINILKPSYEAGMASVMASYKSGEPVFFYTWAPNWTIFKLKPGKDVMWINVPEIVPTESQEKAVDRMTVSGVEGAVSDPVKVGFVVSDIQVVANKKFLAENPAAKKFFEVFSLPLSDINEQNTRMNDGEKSEKDIARHVDEWIAKNGETWNSWLEAARAAAN